MHRANSKCLQLAICASCALLPTRSQAAAGECHTTKTRCERTKTALQMNPGHFSTRTVKVRSFRIHQEAKTR